ncbi:MAG: preprotein translocase subunit SecG [Flavobacteriales bacterium]|nr:MAG: preprotein translocase subunit SecG [Flavobacteriales bacterium]
MSYTLFLILIVIVAVLLILVIMVQNPKGGGLSSSFGGAGTQNLGGVKNTTNFLDKSTWTLATALGALILLSNFAIPRDNVNTQSQIEETLNERNTVEMPANNQNNNTVQDTTN